MHVVIDSPRGDAAALDPAIVAAIVVALDAYAGVDASASVAPSVGSAWRLAGRSVDAFDAYDAARFARVARRGAQRA